MTDTLPYITFRFLDPVVQVIPYGDRGEFAVHSGEKDFLISLNGPAFVRDTGLYAGWQEKKMSQEETPLSLDVDLDGRAEKVLILEDRRNVVVMKNTKPPQEILRLSTDLMGSILYHVQQRRFLRVRAMRAFIEGPLIKNNNTVAFVRTDRSVTLVDLRKVYGALVRKTHDVNGHN